MYARLITAPIQPNKLDAFVTTFNERLLPEISQKPGFKSLQLLKDAANNKVIALVLWETEADAHASMEDFQQRRAKIAEFLSGPPSVEMLEVVS